MQGRLFRAGAIALFTLVVGTGVAGAGGCHKGAQKPAQAPREPVKVSVLSPSYQELPRQVRATGTLFGDEETTIAAKVAGRIIEVARDLGDSAAPGEVLARIDPTDYQLARDEREQAFREVLASIGLDELPTETFVVEGLPNVERARLQAANARARYERGKVLADRQPPLISAQDFADLKTEWDVAESNLRVAKLEAEATLAEARTLMAQVRVAEQRVADAVNRAPTHPVRSETGRDVPGGGEGKEAEARQGAETGRVYEIAARYVTVGDFVQIGTPLFRLVDSNPLKLRASIPERRLGTVRVGQTAMVQVESRSKMYPGTVARVSPAVEMQTRNFMVEIVVPNQSKELKPGSFGVAEILIEHERAMVVPETAIVTFAGVHKVVTVVDNKAQEKPVQLGQRHEGMVEVIRGLEETDVIVSRPSGLLSTGAPVVVTGRAETDAAKAPANGAP